MATESQYQRILDTKSKLGTMHISRAATALVDTVSEAVVRWQTLEAYANVTQRAVKARRRDIAREPVDAVFNMLEGTKLDLILAATVAAGCAYQLGLPEAQRRSIVDFLQTNSFATAATIGDEQRQKPRNAIPHGFERVTSVARVLDAPGFYLNTNMAVEIMDATPMNPEQFANLRLPAGETAVWFSDTIELPDTFLSTDVVGRRVRRELESHRINQPVQREGIFFDGMIVHADRKGQPLPNVTLLVRIEMDTDGLLPDFMSKHVEVNPSGSPVMERLVSNVSGIIGFEQWKDAGKIPEPVAQLDPRGRAFQLLSFEHREAFTAATFAGFRQLDVDALYRPRAPRNAADEAGRRPSAHFRSAHWHRFRVGTRQEWTDGEGEYVTHFIRKIEVNKELGDAGKAPVKGAVIPTALRGGFTGLYSGAFFKPRSATPQASVGRLGAGSVFGGPSSLN